MKKYKLALVLSGGSALGFAHIGVIETLEKHGIRPDIIVGTSMGAVIGGAYASGMNIAEIKNVGYKVTKRKFFDLNFFRGGGIFNGHQINKIFIRHLGNKKIEDAEIAFACVGIDLVTGEQVVFKKGMLRNAIRVSMNIPALFSPIKTSKGESLIDGGLLNNLPDDVAKQMGADVIIAVDVMTGTYRYTAPKRVADALMSSMHLMIMQQQKNREKHADIELVPYIKTKDNINEMSYNKKKIEKIIESGKVACQESIKQIKELLNKAENKAKNSTKTTNAENKTKATKAKNSTKTTNAENKTKATETTKAKDSK